jgi:hypothetical protein
MLALPPEVLVDHVVEVRQRHPDHFLNGDSGAPSRKLVIGLLLSNNTFKTGRVMI